MMFMLSLTVAVAFWPGLIDPAMAPRWAVLSVAAPMFLFIECEQLPRPLGGFGLLALMLAAISVGWAPDVWTGVEDFSHLAVLAAVFCLGSSAKDLAPAWKGLAAGVTVAAVIGMAQVNGWDGVDQKVPIAGLYMNKNLFAEAGMVALIAVIAERAWLWSVGPAMAVVIGNSRAALGALLAMGCVAVWPRNRKLAVALAALLACMVALQFNGVSLSASERFTFWREAMTHLTTFGHGLGSFAANYPYAEFAHNEGVQLIYEWGIYALLPLGILVYLLTEPTRDSGFFVLLAVCAIGMLSFPFHMPVTGYAAALAAGHLAGLRYRQRHAVAEGAGADVGNLQWNPYGSAATSGGGRPGSGDLHAGQASEGLARPGA